MAETGLDDDPTVLDALDFAVPGRDLIGVVLWAVFGRETVAVVGRETVAVVGRETVEEDFAVAGRDPGS